MLPDLICVSFNKAPTIEDFPLPLRPTITVKTPLMRDFQLISTRGGLSIDFTFGNGEIVNQQIVRLVAAVPREAGILDADNQLVRHLEWRRSFHHPATLGRDVFIAGCCCGS